MAAQLTFEYNGKMWTYKELAEELKVPVSFLQRRRCRGIPLASPKNCAKRVSILGEDLTREEIVERYGIGNVRMTELMRSGQPEILLLEYLDRRLKGYSPGFVQTKDTDQEEFDRLLSKHPEYKPLKPRKKKETIEPGSWKVIPEGWYTYQMIVDELGCTAAIVNEIGKAYGLKATKRIKYGYRWIYVMDREQKEELCRLIIDAKAKGRDIRLGNGKKEEAKEFTPEDKPWIKDVRFFKENYFPRIDSYEFLTECNTVRVEVPDDDF